MDMKRDFEDSIYLTEISVMFFALNAYQKTTESRRHGNYHDF